MNTFVKNSITGQHKILTERRLKADNLIQKHSHLIPDNIKIFFNEFCSKGGKYKIIGNKKEFSKLSQVIEFIFCNHWNGLKWVKIKERNQLSNVLKDELKNIKEIA